MDEMAMLLEKLKPVFMEAYDAWRESIEDWDGSCHADFTGESLFEMFCKATLDRKKERD